MKCVRLSCQRDRYSLCGGDSRVRCHGQRPGEVVPPADALRAGVLRAFEENAIMATDVGVYLTRVDDSSISEPVEEES